MKMPILVSLPGIAENQVKERKLYTKFSWTGWFLASQLFSLLLSAFNYVFIVIILSMNSVCEFSNYIFFQGYAK